MSERTYRTESGTYSESDLAVLVWLNPEHPTKPQSRLLLTMTDTSNANPMAFPITSLRKTSAFSRCPLSSDSSVADDVAASTPETPAIIPLPVARGHLGWTDFYIPTKYTEPKK